MVKDKFTHKKYKIIYFKKNNFVLLEKRQTWLNIFWRIIIPIMIASFGALFAYYLNGKVKSQTDIQLLYYSTENIIQADNKDVKIYLNGQYVKKEIRRDKNLLLEINPYDINIIGVENTKNKNDSILFSYEESLLDSIKHTQGVSGGFELADEKKYFFHKIVSPQDFNIRKFIFFNLPKAFTSKPPAFFLSYPKETMCLIGKPLIRYDLEQSDSLVQYILTEMNYYFRQQVDYVESFSTESYLKYKEEYKIDVPEFNINYWYVPQDSTKRKSYAKDVQMMFRSTIFLMPLIYRNAENDIRARFIIDLAAIGEIQFDPFEVRNCNLDPGDDSFLEIGENSGISLFKLLKSYINAYKTYVNRDSINISQISKFINISRRLAIDSDVDWLEWNGNTVKNVKSGSPSDARPIIIIKPITPQNPEVIRQLADSLDRVVCKKRFDVLNIFWTENRWRIRDSLNFKGNKDDKRFIWNSFVYTYELLEPNTICEGIRKQDLYRMAKSLIKSIDHNFTIPRQKRYEMVSKLERMLE